MEQLLKTGLFAIEKLPVKFIDKCDQVFLFTVMQIYFWSYNISNLQLIDCQPVVNIVFIVMWNFDLK